MSMFNPKIPKAGSIRIGSPPQKGKNYPSKLDHFEFATPEKDGKYYPRDESMHNIFGKEPKIIGPIFLKSDSLVESIGMEISEWKSSKIKARRKCFKKIDPFGKGDMDNGLPASQLFKEKNGKLGYRDRTCLGNECPDFIKAKGCGPGLCYKFYIPTAPRIGEYWLAAGSYLAINASLGFIETMRRVLVEDPDTRSLIGLSRIPLAFVIKKGSVRHEGKDTVVYYPELTIDRRLIESSRENGIMNALPTLVSSENKRMLSSGKTVTRMQKREAEDSIYVGKSGDLSPGMDVVIDTKYDNSSVDNPDAAMHKPYALKDETVVDADPAPPVKREKTPVKTVSTQAKTVPTSEKSKTKPVKKEAVKKDKVLDTKVHEEYKGDEAEVEAKEKELVRVLESSADTIVTEEPEETLAEQILTEEPPSGESSSGSGLRLVSQLATSEGIEKKLSVIKVLPEGYNETAVSGIYEKAGDQRNDVEFVFDLSSGPGIEEMMKGFILSKWTFGKLRFQLSSKPAKQVNARLAKFIPK